MAAVLLVAGCTAGKLVAPAPPPLVDVLRDEIARQDGLIWSADRPLTIADFKGAAPAVTGQEGARTAYSLFNGALCTGQRFQYSVIAAVLPGQSWMSPTVRASTEISARTLRHEQTHFDLTEVHARRLRKTFAEMTQPCTRTEAQLRAVSERVIRDEALEQRRYDDATNHGRNTAQQTVWDREVAARLAEAARFGR